MNNKHDQRSIRERILAAIQDGQIEMRSRWYFVFHAVLAAIGGLIIFFVLFYLVSFIVFMLEETGVWFVPAFGPAGWYELFTSLPWLLILLSLLFIGVLEIVVRRYAFAYRQPLLFSAMGIMVIVILGSALIMQVRLHGSLLRFAERNKLPFAGRFYRDLSTQHLRNVHVGTIVEIASSSAFMMQTRRGELLAVNVAGETQFPFGIDFVEGDTVVVFGQRTDDAIRALGIRKVDSEFGPSMPNMNRRRPFYPFMPR